MGNCSCCHKGVENEEDLADYAKNTDSPAALAFSKGHSKTVPVIKELYSRFLRKGADSVSVIDIKEVKLKEVDCELLAKLMQELSGLTEVVLVNNELGHYGVSQISDSTSNLVHLEKLVLNWNLLDNSCLDELCPTFPFMKNLRVLGLAKNKFDDAGAQVLAEQLRHFTRLTELDVSGNRIRLSGMVRIAEEVKGIKGIKVVKFDDNYLTKSETERVFKILPELTNNSANN